MKKIVSFSLISIILATFLIAISPVYAETFHVYDGDDIVSIIGSANSGDTIYVHSGTYLITQRILIPGQSTNISIIGDSPETTIIDGTSLISGDVINGANDDYVTIKNLTIKNAKDRGIQVRNNAYVENCITENNYNAGVYINNNGTIKNCIVIGSTNGNGFRLGNNCTIINCTSVYNKQDGISGQDGNKVINCITAYNLEDGVDIDDVGEYSISYSNSWNNSNYDWGNPANKAEPDSTCISMDPLFVRGKLGDYYLSLLSPCIDIGSGTSDALGLYNRYTTRTDSKWDIGTVDIGFHYTSDRGPPTSLPIDQILKILKNNQEE